MSDNGRAPGDRPKPATMIIGGGVAGMMAALDIADAGYPVYLVEKTPSVGGRMIQLDKTFPTLDCSACILTPKMVDTGGHPNIKLMTYSEVQDITGSKGDFQVKVLHKARYVDEDKCTACGDCIKVCPVDVISEYDYGLGLRKATYLLFPQAVPAKNVIDKRGAQPCREACPAKVNVQGYVALIGVGKYQEAIDLIRERNPFPSVCGRVCHHPCEAACNRTGYDGQPVAIRALKRFVADVEYGLDELPPVPERKEDKGKRVAVVGAGPSGLTAAADLALEGYEVVVFEALSVAGGMLATGIPDYRLPPQALQQDIRYIERLGVEIRLNTPIGKDITLEQLQGEFDAVYLAVGAHKSRRLGVEGENLDGVLNGVAFLRDVCFGKETGLGKKVTVVGGGNVAIDAARSALRLGAEKVTIVYRRSRAEMPANEWEIEEAEEEGIHLIYLATPLQLIGKDGRAVGMECIRMELGEPDESGRRRPVPVPGSEFTIECDTVIPAIGQMPDLSFVGEDGPEVTRWSTLMVDPDTFQTSIPGVFAGGDAVTGPGMAIEAIGQGKRAAEAILRYLAGESLDSLRVHQEPDIVDYDRVDTRLAKVGERQKMGMLSPAERVQDFREAEIGFDETQALSEAKRCLNCGPCSECMECVRACQAHAIDHSMVDRVEEYEVGAIIVATGFDPMPGNLKPELGYGVYPEVLTAMEFERLLNSSGPTAGEVRLGQMVPKDIVFIHCVGSRDPSIGHPWCSRVCCLYTVKQAHLAMERVPGVKCTVFYMDIRAYGKLFEELYDRVREEGAIYRRGNPAEVLRKNGRLVVRAEDTLLNDFVEVETDLVVLAIGLQPSAETQRIAEMLGLELTPDGFFKEKHYKMHPVETNQLGVFLAGCAQGPRDVTDTVAQAKAAASSAMTVMRQMEMKA